MNSLIPQKILVNFFTIHRILPLPVNTGFSVSGVTQFISLFMRLLQYWTMLCLLLGMSAMDLSAADSDHGVAEVTSTTELHALASGESHDQAHGEGEHHGLPPSAVPVFHLGPLVITNSMVATILVAAIIIFAAQRATRTVRAVPIGGQNFFEWLVEGLFGFLEGIMGAELVKKTFWFFASLFLFILATNWFGLIPGIGTIGWETSDGHFEPWLRGAQADLNMTSAMAVAFFCPLDRLGTAGQWRQRTLQSYLWQQRWWCGFHEMVPDRHFLLCGYFGSGFHPVPACLLEFPFVW